MLGMNGDEVTSSEYSGEGRMKTVFFFIYCIYIYYLIFIELHSNEVFPLLMKENNDISFNNIMLFDHIHPTILYCPPELLPLPYPCLSCAI